MKYRRTVHGVAFPLPNEAMVREPYLGKRVDAPDVPIVKDFISFSAAASCSKIVELFTVNFINVFAE